MMHATAATELRYQVPSFVSVILQKFMKQGWQIYIVGGAVRDLLLGRSVTDWDFTTDQLPDKIRSLFRHTIYDNPFGTVGVLDPQQLKHKPRHQKADVYEITTFRTEHGYSDKRRPDRVEWGKSLEQDLSRRDFTISAMALEPVKQLENHTWLFRLHDPYHGKQDLELRLIRAVGDPQKRFGEDALRMLRAIRIAAQLGFNIESKTLQAITQLADNITQVSWERIRDEMAKLLASDYPDQATQMMSNTGLLQHILPELEQTQGVMQSGHHQDDVWHHSLKSLKYCPSRDWIVRLATLLHDIGKVKARAYVCPECQGYFRHHKIADQYQAISPEQITCPYCGYQGKYREMVVFHNHEVIGAEQARAVAQRLRLSKKDVKRVYQLVRWHMFSVDERQTVKAVRRFIRNVGPENLEDILALRTADRLGGGARETSWRFERFKKLLAEAQKQPFTVHDLKIDGHQVMQLLDLPPGPQVGQVLNQLFEEVVEGQLPNDEQHLKQRVKQLGELMAAKSG